MGVSIISEIISTDSERRTSQAIKIIRGSTGNNRILYHYYAIIIIEDVKYRSSARNTKRFTYII